MSLSKRRGMADHAPARPKTMLVLMMAAVIALVVAVVGHFVVGSGLLSGNLGLDVGEAWSLRLEALRRLAITAHLLAVAFGLGSIIRVLRFQSARLSAM